MPTTILVRKMTCPKNTWFSKKKEKNNSSLVKCAHFEFHYGKLIMLCTIGFAKMDKR
jgi:hypothetical protein